MTLIQRGTSFALEITDDALGCDGEHPLSEAERDWLARVPEQQRAIAARRLVWRRRGISAPTAYPDAYRREATTPGDEVYRLVVRDVEQRDRPWVEFSATRMGWAQRRAYDGPMEGDRPALERIPDDKVAYGARETGWPGLWPFTVPA